MKLFKDLGDVAKKLLNDDFITDNKVKLTSKTSDNTSYSISALSTSKSDDYIGELTLKSKVKDNVTLSAKLNTISPVPIYEVKYEGVKNPGSMYQTKNTITCSGNQDTAKLKADIITSKLAVSIDSDILKRSAVASITTNITPKTYNSFLVIGAQGQFSVASDGSYAANNSKVSASLFDGLQSEIHLSVLNISNPSNFILNYSHLVRPGFSVAGQVNYSRQDLKAVATMATAVKLDGATTIKSKLDTNGSASLAYIQKIRPHTEVALSSTFDVTKFDTAKVGLAITLE